MNRAASLPTPGLLLGAYPERADDGRSMRFGGCPAPTIPEVRQQLAALAALRGDAFEAAVRAARLSLQRDGTRREHVAVALALACVAFERVLRVRLFDTQLAAARIVLQDRLAEMATGEGKTYAVALAAAVCALGGIPVHVITANDYLVTRDATMLAPVYGVLGLSVGAVTQDLAREQRRHAYAQPVTYCTAKEVAFDYLRDGLVRERDPVRAHLAELCSAPTERPVLRGLCMAIVDEADHVLIDEARVPLVLAAPAPRAEAPDTMAHALALAQPLREGVHFVRAHKACELTPAGQAEIARLAAGLGAGAGPWRNRVHRESMVQTALCALHVFRRDHEYLVRDGEVLVIDTSTGRLAPGRTWSLGLHQAIESKEGCALSEAQSTIAQITYQRFFARYLRLAGVSGTLHESRRELRAVYDLRVERVAERHASRRRTLPTRLFADRATLWAAVARRIVDMAGIGRPVLVGTDSVADSDELSRCLRAHGIEHAVLSARHDHIESAIVAGAGRRGAATVATNMAGRGTDIPLEDGVAELGGLHVICCQLNAARRIDRQLAGRCARQGDPGSVE
ncbi:MAG TPA: prepilin peptidase, partial [Burkholderiaceae bacterium]|nr:prepilin peptidase [Burkholderiaceae bacterium]